MTKASRKEKRENMSCGNSILGKNFKFLYKKKDEYSVPPIYLVGIEYSVNKPKLLYKEG